ncbi:L-threonylcarbamoyladenylate synthase [Hydromonas duriensis]|uniref:Threonylcarbamoyl-AMP synthase n=1 Tax=Hydromonas duriensis TaxID=1527608 RepID=A0A4R6Y9K5_9BURK|nr:L-threonylcarbamoyladenylate synthase [Hydromonas duriensis]TDR32175.1 translation factor SUA5 [Hydromonas duriensis]
MTKTLTQNVVVAAQKLVAGEVIGLPTETVYGLAADAQNPRAVAKIFTLKNRPTTHPLITHIATDADVFYWLDSSRLTVEMRELMDMLIDAFWPGPLTLVLPKSPAINTAVTGGQQTIALRCPDHPLAQAVLKELSHLKNTPHVGIAAPSANRFGRVSPTRAQHVRDEFGETVWVLDGDASVIGIESTIIDLTRGAPVLLRHGHITPDDVFEVTGLQTLPSDAHAPRVSGTLLAHYAPATPLVWASEASLSVCDDAACLCFSECFDDSAFKQVIRLASEPKAYARGLYHALRELDAEKHARIIVEDLPESTAWDAVRDRLKRAIVGSNQKNNRGI